MRINRYALILTITALISWSGHQILGSSTFSWGVGLIGAVLSYRSSENAVSLTGHTEVMRGLLSLSLLPISLLITHSSSWATWACLILTVLSLSASYKLRQPQPMETLSP